MPLYRISGKAPGESTSRTLFIRADSATQALVEAQRRGDFYTTVDVNLESKPTEGTESDPIDATKPENALARLEHCALVRRPVWTIAAGVVLGLFLWTLLGLLIWAFLSVSGYPV